MVHQSGGSAKWITWEVNNIITSILSSGHRPQLGVLFNLRQQHRHTSELLIKAYIYGLWVSSHASLIEAISLNMVVAQ